MKAQTPTSDYDKELSAAGKRRVQVMESVRLSNGDIVNVYREKIVDDKFDYGQFKLKKGRKRMNVDIATVNEAESAVNSMIRSRKVRESTPKAPRSGSKLSQAVELVNEAGKDDKESCLARIMEVLGVTRGNATIYYAKAKVILG